MAVYIYLESKHLCVESNVDINMIKYFLSWQSLFLFFYLLIKLFIQLY